MLILYLYTFIHFKDDSNFMENLSKMTLTPFKNKSESTLLPNICYSPIHNLNLSLYLPFINDAYYFDDNANNSSFNKTDYKEMFFDKGYYIKVFGNLINKNSEKDQVKMIQYNVKTPNYDKIIILSIKGTSNRKDVYLDIQLYFP